MLLLLLVAEAGTLDQMLLLLLVAEAGKLDQMLLVLLVGWTWPAPIPAVFMRNCS